MADVVIVGGGLAAVRTAMALRSEKFEGSILILSDEDEAPYDRPPLSKKYLLGEADDDAIALLKPARLDKLDLEIRLGAEAESIDRDRKVVVLAGGEEIGYGTLVAATGAGAAPLPVLDGHDNVWVLRTAADARGLRERLGEGVRLGIVGGGFIGLEIAAVAKQLGCGVTVLEGADAPLAPVLGTELGGMVQRWHEDRGIAFETGSFLKAAHGEGSVSELELENGTRVPVDVVVVGVGARRNTGWLESSGLEIGNGLICDEHGGTEDPHVFGVGDVVCVRTPSGDEHPTGHWTATTEQARRAAKAITGERDGGEVTHDFYFWSDQHDKRLQFIGVIPDDPRISVVEEGEEGTFLAHISDGEFVTGVFSLGLAKPFIQASMPIRRGEQVRAT